MSARVNYKTEVITTSSETKSEGFIQSDQVAWFVASIVNRLKEDKGDIIKVRLELDATA